MTQLNRNLLLALLITASIIGTIFYSVSYLNDQRVAQLNEIQDRLATDTLSIETQFALLEQAPCEDLSEGNVLSQEVSSLGDRLSKTEASVGSKDAQVLQLKKQYTLLQIRDYLLTKRLAESCNIDPTVALYFYSNETNACEDCDRAAVNLSYMRDTYPSLRVYSFDYNLDLGALKTLIAVQKVEPKFPAFVIDGKRSYGFEDLEDFKTRFPKSLLETASSTASSTKIRE